MENYAYSYAIDNDLDIPIYYDVDQETNTLDTNTPLKKVAMKDIFDMTAGTSTGSIIAAALTFPSNKAPTIDTNATNSVNQ